MHNSDEHNKVLPDKCYPLPDYNFIEISGPEAVKFVQAQVTCDMRRLEQQDWLLGAQCNSKGRMVLSFVAFQKQDSVYLRVHTSLEQALEGLKKYAVFTKVKFAQLKMSACAIVGENILDRMALELNLPALLTLGKFQILGDAVVLSRANDWIEFYGDCEPITLWMEQGYSNGKLIKVQDFDAELIKRGIAEVRSQTAEEFIPQMFNLDQIDAISFKKGCYTGQEIVARMQYLGKLKKRLYKGFVADAHLPVGAQLYSASQSDAQGEVVISCGEEFLAVVNDQAVEQQALSSPACEPSKIQWRPRPYAITM